MFSTVLIAKSKVPIETSHLPGLANVPSTYLIWTLPKLDVTKPPSGKSSTFEASTLIVPVITSVAVVSTTKWSITNFGAVTFRKLPKVTLVVVTSRCPISRPVRLILIPLPVPSNPGNIPDVIFALSIVSNVCASRFRSNPVASTVTASPIEKFKLSRWKCNAPGLLNTYSPCKSPRFLLMKLMPGRRTTWVASTLILPVTLKVSLWNAKFSNVTVTVPNVTNVARNPGAPANVIVPDAIVNPVL